MNKRNRRQAENPAGKPALSYMKHKDSRPRAGESRLLKWGAAVVMLGCILLLGGCIRFGPQADEMADTSAGDTEQSKQQTSSAGQPEASPSGEASDTQTEDPSAASPSDETAEEENDESTDSKQAESASDAADDEPAADRIEIEVTRDDTERTVRFDLQRLPSGYSLAGLTWEPDAAAQEILPSGTSAPEVPADPPAAESAVETKRITATYQDAVIAGEAETEGFFIDEDGQRIGYRYGEAEAGQAGSASLEFRDAEGSSRIWTGRITLGTAPAEEESADTPG
ncbi:hypothetical protein [Saccharibacillus qingshengii]|uniref:hypothetical protein n=1 Tax=Saccharibacillus qingshengii TaxID=1763540 RepID=UPI001551E759|nr:hypothetical protein [Saccharibacillus qingshengii]